MCWTHLRTGARPSGKALIGIKSVFVLKGSNKICSQFQNQIELQF